MQGFIVFDYLAEYDAGRKQLAQWLAEGKLKRKETIIKGGVAASDEAFKVLFQGRNIGESLRKSKILREVVANCAVGKTLLEVKNPDDQARL